MTSGGLASKFYDIARNDYRRLNLLHLKYDRIDREAFALCSVDAFHSPRFLGAEDVFHFHCFDHRKRLACLDGVADANMQSGEQPWHRADQEFGKVRRDFLDHMAGQMRDMSWQHARCVAGAACGEFDATPSQMRII